MSRPRVIVDLRLPCERKQRVTALETLRRIAARHGTEFQVRTPRQPLTPAEHVALARDVCRPFGVQKHGGRGGGS